MFLLQNPAIDLSMHVADPSIIGAHMGRALAGLYNSINGPTLNFVKQHALNWVVGGLRRLPLRVGGPHKWLVWQSSDLAFVRLEEPNLAAAHAEQPLHARGVAA